MTRPKLRAVWLLSLVVLGTLAVLTTVGASAAAAGNQSSAQVEIVGIGTDGSGNLYVTVRGTTSEPVTDLKFWYNDTDTATKLGPTQYGDGNFDTAFYTNGSKTAFSAGDSISTATPDVKFVFDSIKTSYQYKQHPFLVNVTAFDETYGSTDGTNRSVITGQHYDVSAQDHQGTSLTDVPVMLYDESTNESLGHSFIPAATGSMVFHCRGVEVGDDCQDPDANSPGTLVGVTGKTYPAPVTFESMSLAESNATGKTDVARGQSTLTADRPAAISFLQWSAMTGGGSAPAVEEIYIRNESSNTIVWQNTNVGGGFTPTFLDPNSKFNVTFNDPDGFGSERRYYATGSKGMSFVQYRIDTASLSTSTVTGQVVNESGDPVADAVVFAEPDRSPGDRIDVYNSTTTDSNGIFSMTLPETAQLSRNYGIRMVGTDASGGTPIYFPTVDNNHGDGYTVKSGKTVLPPVTIEKGGLVDIDVSGTIPGRAFGSLSGTSTAYPSMTRESTSNSLNTFSFGAKTPGSASVAMMSPTTGTQSQVAYNIWGRSNNPINVCGEAVSVSQGAETSASCTLETAGFLNISVQEYGSILQQTSSSQADLESFRFFWSNELVIRNATNGNLMTYLGPDGMRQYMLNRPGSSNDIKIPVPAGDYSVHLRPADRSVEQTTVNDTATYSVASGGTTDVTLDRADEFKIRPVFGRMTESLTRSENNVIAVFAADPATGSRLDDTDPVSVSVRLLHPNGTVASGRVELTHNSSDGSFDTTSFKPSNLNVDAGSYLASVTVSYSQGDRTYNSTISGPVQVSGFNAGMALGTRTAAPGDDVLGQLHAYSGGSGLDANAADIDIKIFDQNGKLVNQTTPSNGISSGQGSFTVTMPDTPGRYRIQTKIEDTTGNQGIAQRSIRVSKVDLSVETDKDVYQPTGTVTLRVEATDSTDGSAITDASIEARINNQRARATTNSEGVATIDLDPGTYATGPTWTRGHGIGVTLRHETASDVIQKTTGTGFEVQAFPARASPTADRFGTAEKPKIDVSIPTSVTVTGVSLVDVDGDTEVSADSTSNPASGLRRVTLQSQAVGSHVATVRVNTQKKGSQTATTQFDVKDNSVEARLSSRTVQTGESVDLTVAVRDSNGKLVSGTAVDAWLNASNPVTTTDTASGSTGSDGSVTFSLSSDVAGKHFVRVNVGQQERYLGLRVSDVTPRLEDSSGTEVSGYQAEPGTTETLYVNATTAAGSDVPDDSAVTAYVRAFGDTIELGNAKTTNGDASIDYEIPTSVPAREYTMIVEVTTKNGGGTTTGTLNVTGGNAFEIDAAMNQTALSAGETALLDATVATGDGSAVTGKSVDFVLQTAGNADDRVATVATDANGVATYNHTVASDASEGEWVLKTALNDSQSVKDYQGYSVRSIETNVVPESGPFNPGDSVSLTVHVNDSSTGNAVTATGGTVRLNLPGSTVEDTLSLSGSSPYSTTVDVPSDSSVTGTRSVSVTARKDGSGGTDSALIDVENDSESANFSVARPITAGQSTTVTMNGTVDETAVLTAISPNAGTVAHNGSVSISSTGDTQTQLTIDSAGLYLVKLEVPQVGTVTDTVQVKPSGNSPTVWAGPDASSNATSFNRTEDIYIKTNQSGMSATVVTSNESYSVELDAQDGSTYYGVISATRAPGNYIVRLDSASAVGVDDTIIEVNA